MFGYSLQIFARASKNATCFWSRIIFPVKLVWIFYWQMKIVPEFLFVESMSVTYYKVFPTLPVHWVLVIDFGLRQLRKIWLFRIPSFCAESSSKQRFTFQQLVSSEALNWHVKGKTSDFNFLLIASLSRSSRSQILHRFGLIFEVLEKNIWQSIELACQRRKKVNFIRLLITPWRYQIGQWKL